VTGGEVRWRAGTLEVCGGFTRLFLRLPPIRARAMTLGHVILGVDGFALEENRLHERAHVRQCERWGPFFLPAYGLASLWAWVRGGHYYLDNAFEVDAERAERE
jgi:hypothetical protein